MRSYEEENKSEDFCGCGLCLMSGTDMVKNWSRPFLMVKDGMGAENKIVQSVEVQA